MQALTMKKMGMEVDSIYVVADLVKYKKVVAVIQDEKGVWKAYKDEEKAWKDIDKAYNKYDNGKGEVEPRLLWSSDIERDAKKCAESIFGMYDTALYDNLLPVLEKVRR